MRDLKMRINENIRKHNEKIAEINTELQIEDPLFEPAMKVFCV